MATLTPQRIVELLDPYYPDPTPKLVDQLSLYLDLLLKWNARTNLSAIREPDEMVRRHFGESLFAARHLPHSISTLLDLGSGAGFPGLPIALARPEIIVTLAESQNKKSSFLREAVRTLAIPVEVWADRVERMPSERRFDAITLRAVDDPTVALKLARERKTPNGLILEMITAPDPAPLDLRIPATRTGMLRFS